ARLQPHDEVVPRLDADVAALRAVGADRRRAVQVPRARLVQEVLRDQRADRADVHDVARPVRVGEALVEERVDDGAVAPLHDAQRILSGDLTHEAHAARAHDAAASLVEDVAAEVVPAEDALLLQEPPVLGPFLRHVVLELALARLVADRAVQRVVDQVELEDALTRLARLRALGLDDLPVSDRRHACRLQLGHPLDLDQAHPAHGRCRETRVVAVVRDADTGALRGLDDARPLGDFDLPAVDRAGDRILLFARHSRPSRLDSPRRWGEALSPDPPCPLNGHRGRQARTVADVGEVLVAELLDRARHGCGRGIAEHADRGARHVLPDVEQYIQVLLPALTPLDAAEDLGQPPGALAAGRALAAGLVGVELHDPPDLLHDAGRIVHHDHGRRAQHAAGLRHTLVVHRDVDLVRAQDRHRAAARNHGLERAAVADPAADVVDQLLQVEAQGQLEVATPDNVARDVEQLGARALLGAERPVPLGAVPDDVRHGRDRLDVVDRRGHAEGADGRGERRLDAWLAAAALERVHEARLFTADVGARAAVQRDVDVDAGAEDVLAGQPGGVGFL